MAVDQLMEVAAAAVADPAAGTRVELLLSQDAVTTVTAKDAAVETYLTGRTATATVTVSDEHSQASATVPRCDLAGLRQAVESATAMLRVAGHRAPLAAARAQHVAGDVDARLDAGAAALSPQDRRERAIAVEQAATAADPRVAGVYTAGWEDRLTTSVFADSEGLVRGSTATSSYAFAYVIAHQDGDSRVALARHGGSGVDVDPAAVGAQAREHATRLLGSRTARPGRVRVVLDPEVTADVLYFLGQTLTGRAAAAGSSPFARRLGELVASPHLGLRDDPRAASAPGWAAFDDEGTPTRPVDLVSNGVLSELLHDRRSAQEAGCMSTGSAVINETFSGAQPRALRLLPTGSTSERLLADSPGGIYVQAVSGLHSGFDAVTGDLSFGASGLSIEGGELTEPLSGLVVSTDVIRLLTSVCAVADDTRWIQRSAGTTVAIDDVMVGAA